ncbi:Dynein heavy chain [Glycine soja]
MVAITPAKVPQPPFFRGYDSKAMCAYNGRAPGHSIEHCRALKHKVQGLINAVPIAFRELHALVVRGLHALAFRGLHVLTFRGLHVLAFRGLHVLAFRGRHVLAFRGLHVLAFRGLHVLAFRGLYLLAFRGLHALAFRGLHVLAFRGLHALAFRGLHALAFRGVHALAFRGLQSLTFRGLHILAFRGLYALAFRGLHVLAFKGLHICAFRELKFLIMEAANCASTTRGAGRNRAHKTPSEPKEVQQGLGVSNSDYGPLSVLQNVRHPQQGYQSPLLIGLSSRSIAPPGRRRSRHHNSLGMTSSRQQTHCHHLQSSPQLIHKKARDRQVIMRPAQDVKEALLGGNLELATKKLPAKWSRKGTIEEGSSAAPQADIGFDKHRS